MIYSILNDPVVQLHDWYLCGQTPSHKCENSLDSCVWYTLKTNVVDLYIKKKYNMKGKWKLQSYFLKCSFVFPAIEYWWWTGKNALRLNRGKRKWHSHMWRDGNQKESSIALHNDFWEASKRWTLAGSF